jgi:hypothetical protein
LLTPVLCALAFAFPSVCAFAHDGEDISQGASLNVVLNGAILSDCGIKGGGLLAIGELNGREQVSAPFDLSCNVPFELIFTSSSGGLVHAEKPDGEGPYKGNIPYQLEVSVPGQTPRPVELSGRFRSSALVAGVALSSGEAIAASRGTIVLNSQLGEGEELLAGRYEDSLRITINPRV